ncbi:TonB-dependent siderophore receptor [Paracoccus aminophilus]|uniref:Iron complex, outermembrane recepter protein n=1 Tax=Paracoccus aminophilus JCM 7686 TaxID=1367847 RepID=S5XTU0_PARAH|nr:TonB-dependent siderophore receptor [Paracoccus aminophilus]AGT08577.1 iron complex, outermembrane recepter protein [Paracoccus aminophilus JCM 7686]
MSILSAKDHRPSGRRKFYATLLGCASALAFVPGFALAQATSGAVVQLDTVVIDGTAGDDDAGSIVASRTTSGGKIATELLDTPASVSVITSKEIQERNAQNVEQVLSYSAGVTTDFYGSDDRFDFIKIRGLDAYAYRDGLTLGRPFGGVREEVFAFERVEVLRGANSTTFGVSDPGGAVNYITKRPRDIRFGEAYVTGGSNNLAEVGVDFGDNLTPDATLSYRVTAKVRKADAEYDHSRDNEKFVMGGLTWRPDAATSLTMVVDYLKKDGVPGSGGHPVGSDLPRHRFFGEPDYNYRGTERTTLNLMFEHDFGGGLSFSSNARYSDAKTNFGYAYVSGSAGDGSTTVNRAFFGNDGTDREFIVDARLQYDSRFNGIDSQTLVGVEYRDATSTDITAWGPAPSIDWRNPIYTGRPANVPVLSSSKSEQKGKALYLQQNLTFSEKWIATLGLRHDWIDTTNTDRLAATSQSGEFSETTKRLGLTYKLNEDLSLYGSYAESVVPASLTVEPEEGDQLEFGVKYRPAGTNALLTAAVYDLTKKNMTRIDPITNRPATIGEVRVRGLDLEGKAELSDRISLIGSYSYLDSEITRNGTLGNEGKRLTFVPRHTASVWVNYTLAGNESRGDMTFGLGGRFTGSYYFNDANTVGTGSNFTVDAAYSYQLEKNTALALNVSNLFDRKHIDYGGFGADFYNPGREVSVSLRRSW